jgi:hypothetical protein
MHEIIMSIPKSVKATAGMIGGYKMGCDYGGPFYVKRDVLRNMYETYCVITGANLYMVSRWSWYWGRPQTFRSTITMRAAVSRTHDGLIASSIFLAAYHSVMPWLN